MEQPTLQQHIATLVRAGTNKATINEQLLAVGWSEEEIDRAYADALIAEGTPIPSEGARSTYGKKASTLDVVVNFFSFILLGIIATALGTLYFEIIGKYFPDTLSQMYSYRRGLNTDAIYYAIAALLVAYPVYYVAVRTWFKRFREDEAKMESKLTKWLTYLVLLVTSVTIVGDLIAILFTFFQGELSVRFFLKALTILVIAGMVFGFYFLERKKVQYRQEIPRRVFRLFGYALTVLVAFGIIMGFVAAGSPATERMRTFDERRAQELQDLARCVARYAEQFEVLPGALMDIERSSNYSYCDFRDPETDTEYGYRVVRPLMRTSPNVLTGEIELCAVFALESSADTIQRYASPDNKWFNHPAGRACDTELVTVRQELSS